MEVGLCEPYHKKSTETTDHDSREAGMCKLCDPLSD